MITIIVILSGLLIWALFSIIKKENQINKTYTEIEKEIYNKEINKIKEKVDRENQQYEAIHNQRIQALNKLNGEIQEKQNFNSSLQKIREDELNRLMEQKKQALLEQIDREVDEWACDAQTIANENYEYECTQLRAKGMELKNELAHITEQIDDFKQKQQVINQEILRQRAIVEKQDFYKIQLDESSKEDINYLLSIIDHFHNKDTIYKLIWTEYIQKPFKNMLNRVLNNRDPKNIIYMIQNTETQEIYIGKTKSEASKRWTEHIKTSLHIGGQNPKKIHKAMFQNWDKFTFSILEEVPITKNLSERELYYINFYESNIFGYNMIK